MNEKQKEAAARKLCELRGINPDQQVSHGADPDSNGYVPAICLYSPAWRLVLKEIENYIKIEQAIRYGNGF